MLDVIIHWTTILDQNQIIKFISVGIHVFIGVQENYLLELFAIIKAMVWEQKGQSDKDIRFIDICCISIWCATQEKGPYAICGQRRPWSACAFAQADQGLRCPLKESMDTVVYVDEYRKSKSDYMEAHSRPDRPCSHIN